MPSRSYSRATSIAVCRVRDVAEAGVDHDLDAVASGRLRGGGERDVVLGSLPSGPQPSLTAVKFCSTQRGHGCGHLGGRVGHQHRGVGAHPVAVRRAEQLVDRLAERLALDVPERDVEAADRVDRDPAPAEVDEAAVHLLPEPLDVERVLADQDVAQAHGNRVGARRLDERLDELGRRVDLADARDALVGVDPDDEVVLAPVCDSLVHDRLS